MTMPANDGFVVSDADADTHIVLDTDIDTNTDTGIVFAGLTYSITNHQGVQSQILHHATGAARPGEVLAIMGPSGAGKTTLLNLLSGRTRKDEGYLTINGDELTKRVRRRLSYVAQEDKLFSNLTVRETFEFAATLRLSESIPASKKQERVESVITELGLEDCAGTRVGGGTNRGISGGQMKRTSIGVELISKPSVLLLDEPTTGLDSRTALNLVTSLRELAQNEHCAIVMSIHQPSSQIWAKFDKVLLVTKGHAVFCGAQSDVLPYLRDVTAQECAEHYNPADFLLDVLSDDGAADKLCVAVKERLSTSCVQCRSTLAPESDVEWCAGCAPAQRRGSKQSILYDSMDTLTSQPRFATSWSTQFRALSKRAMKQGLPDLFSWLNWAQTLAISALVAMSWFQTEKTEEASQDRVGLIFFMTVYWGFNVAFHSVSTFFNNRDIILKERIAGTYSLSSYVVAKSVAELPLALVLPSTCFVIVYWATGLRTGWTFLYAWLVVILQVLSVQAVGLFIGAAIIEFKKALITMQVFILGAMLIGGFYAQQLPDAVQFLSWTSFVKYSWHALLTLEFKGVQGFTCAPIAKTEFEVCRNNATRALGVSGDQILERRDIVTNLPLLLSLLAALGLIFRIGTYVALRWLHGTHARGQL
eukprot:m.482683 g.482683  ORF g.482683 m.482683 type:complete len:647 (-) comp22631_c0_seq1:199-2139(-)